jgi:DNA-3-methyladenine glycosylase I
MKSSFKKVHLYREFKNSFLQLNIMPKSCSWPGKNELMIEYHDVEWGVPLYDDTKLFEFIVLDSFQAGLSWSTIINKRNNFRLAFDDFNPEKIALYKENKIKELMNNQGIIRNNLKIKATISNAACFLKIQKEFGSFCKYIWQFVNGRPVNNSWKTLQEIPARTKESDAMSKDLIKRGFKFAGSTICYAFMQASGMVNDHLVDCFRYKEIIKMQR